MIKNFADLCFCNSFTLFPYSFFLPRGWTLHLLWLFFCIWQWYSLHWSYSLRHYWPSCWEVCILLFPGLFISSSSFFQENSSILQCTFAATCATIVSGAFDEHCKFNGYIIFSIILTGVVYPIQRVSWLCWFRGCAPFWRSCGPCRSHHAWAKNWKVSAWC